MSKSIKFSLLILILLLVASCAFCFYIFAQKQKLHREKSAVEQQLEKTQWQEKEGQVRIKKLEGDIKKTEEEKNKLMEDLQNTQVKLDELTVELQGIASEKDGLAMQVDTLKKERNDLSSKAESLSKQIEELKKSQGEVKKEMSLEELLSEAGEEYWASVLKEKALLQAELDKLEGDLAQNTLTIVDLKKQNADFELELGNLKGSKDTIDREIEYKGDLINGLSLELVRAKNDKKFLKEKLDEFNEENKKLREEIKNLVGAKSTLEKNIVLLTKDKEQLQKKLEETEGLIQTKINEIFEIKESLDQLIPHKNQTAPVEGGSSLKKLDLQPVIVDHGQENSNSSDASQSSGASKKYFGYSGLNGKILNINEENNFVIVDIGENSGILQGDRLTVFRDDHYLGRLEVLQVRKDVCAADIRDQQAQFAVGDVVK